MWAEKLPRRPRLASFWGQDLNYRPLREGPTRPEPLDVPNSHTSRAE